MNGLIELVVLTILAIAAPSVIWFYRVRKNMIIKQKMIIETLETVFKPRDKLYTLIGYLVGFKASYRLGDGKIEKIWIMYTTPPSHVFFYLPVIFLAKEKERLELTIAEKTSSIILF